MGQPTRLSTVIEPSLRELMAVTADAAERDPEAARRDFQQSIAEDRKAQQDAADRESRRATMVPSHFRSASFATFAADTEPLAKAKRATERWVAAVLDGKSPMLALVGEVGTGKSHLLYAAANALIDRGHPLYAHPWYRMATALRYGAGKPFANAGRKDAYEIREDWWGAKIVMLDEVRPTANTAFDDTELAMFACHAYDSDIPVLLTTNVYPLADVVGPAAASRFFSLVVTGEDKRQERRAA